MRILHVCCAIIEKGDGTILLAQRSANMSTPLKWEFPGGKLEAGEDKEECLLRELKEELGVNAHIIAALPTVVSENEKRKIYLYPFICRLAKGEVPKRLEHQSIQWIPAQEGYTLDLSEGDIPVLQLYLRALA